MDFSQETTGKQLLDAFSAQITKTKGSLEKRVDNLSTAEKASTTSLVYALDDKHFQKALDSQAAIIIAPTSFADHIPDACLEKRAFLLCDLPELLATKIKQKMSATPTPYKEPYKDIHPSAVIDKSTNLGEGVVVGPNAVIGAHCEIGGGTFVGANAIIQSHVKIGAGSTIHGLAFIGHSTEMGKNCEIMPHATIASEGFGYSQDKGFNHTRIPHTGKVILGDNVHVGANSAIDRGTLENTSIGDGTRIDNLVHIAHNLTIGKNCLITACVVFAGSTKVGDNFVVGGNASINGHIEICDNVKVAGLSGVNHDITKPGTYGGFPIQPMRKFLRNQASFAKLGELRKTVSELSRKLKS